MEKPSKSQIEELLNAGNVHTAASALGILTNNLAALCNEHGIPWPGEPPRLTSPSASKATTEKDAREMRHRARLPPVPPTIPKPDASGRVTLSRSELYNLVWSYPIIVLAGEWGISDVGLAKVCKRNNIPKPGLGAWAKMQNGHQVKRPLLPKAHEDYPIRISGQSQIGPQEYGKNEEQEPTIWDKEIQRITAVGGISMPEQHASPHPLTEPSDRSLRRCRVDSRGMKSVCLKKGFPITCSEVQIERALKVFNGLVRALEERQFQLTFDSAETIFSYESFSPRSGWSRTSEKKQVSQLIVHVLQETVRIDLTEQTDSRAYNPEEYPKKQGSEVSLWYYHPSWLYTPNGELTLRILEDVDGRKSWRDGKNQRVEECVESFLKGIVKAAESKVVKREERERKQREWQELQRRIEEERRREEKAKQRLNQLWQDIEGWEKAGRIRDFIAAIAEKSEALNPQDPQLAQVREWIEWAIRVADALDPIKNNLPELSEYGMPRDRWRNW